MPPVPSPPGRLRRSPRRAPDATAATLGRSVPLALIAALCLGSSALADPAGALELTEARVVQRLSAGGRSPVRVDLLGYLEATEKPVRETLERGLRLGPKRIAKLQPIKAGEGGWFKDRRLVGGTLFAEVKLDKSGRYLLHAPGASVVEVNGVPRAGDPYARTPAPLPVRLAAGTNRLTLSVARGRVRVRLEPLESDIVIPEVDATLPDIRVDELTRRATEAGGKAYVPIPVEHGAVLIAHAGADFAAGLVLEAGLVGGPSLKTALPPLAPTTLHRASFRFPVDPARLRVIGEGPERRARLELRLTDASRDETGTAVIASASFLLRLRDEPGEDGAPDLRVQRRTFLSELDGSVQYWALRPPSDAGLRDQPPGIVLSLHGASVEATGQARAYAPHPGLAIVCPTNRQPFGFDWEDWGRADGFEVLEEAGRALGADPARTYLTGHSMGGHGAWHFAVTRPDRFAVVAPSAGWVSFWSYGGKRRGQSPLAKLLMGVSRPSDTLSLLPNLAPLAVRALHGAKDDNVPADQARRIFKDLKIFHGDARLHVEPGAGHWWNKDPEPGADCVDWPGFFKAFAQRRRPSAVEVDHIDFRTAHPSISSRCHWLRVETLTELGELGRVRLSRRPRRGEVEGTTENVERLALDLTGFQRRPRLRVTLDDALAADIAWPTSTTTLRFARGSKGWQVAQADPARKRPGRYGPFRRVFRRRVLLIVGTGGDAAEQQAALATARLHAETFLIRGNGRLEIRRDTEVSAEDLTGRHLLLYGRSDTHALWDKLLGASPVQVGTGSITIRTRDGGTQTDTGEALVACLVRPNPLDPDGLVGAVAATGPRGYAVARRIPIFVSGAAMPDLFIVGPEMLRRGEAGVVRAANFDNDWQLNPAALVSPATHAKETPK